MTGTPQKMLLKHRSAQEILLDVSRDDTDHLALGHRKGNGDSFA